MTLLNHIGLFILSLLVFIVVVTIDIITGRANIKDFYYNKVVYASFYVFALAEATYWTFKIFF